MGSSVPGLGAIYMYMTIIVKSQTNLLVYPDLRRVFTGPLVLWYYFVICIKMGKEMCICFALMAYLDDTVQVGLPIIIY